MPKKSFPLLITIFCFLFTNVFGASFTDPIKYQAYQEFKQLFEKTENKYKQLSSNPSQKHKLQKAIDKEVTKLLKLFEQFEEVVNREPSEAERAAKKAQGINLLNPAKYFVMKMNLWSPGHSGLNKWLKKYSVENSQRRGSGNGQSSGGMNQGKWQHYQAFKKKYNKAKELYANVVEDRSSKKAQEELDTLITEMMEHWQHFKDSLSEPSEEEKRRHKKETGVNLVGQRVWYMKRLFTMSPAHPGLKEWRKENLKQLENPDYFQPVRYKEYPGRYLKKMEKVNKAMGFRLFDGNRLWFEHPGAIALRFGLKLESSAADVLSYKLPTGTWTELGILGDDNKELSSFKPFGIQAYDMRVIGSAENGTTEVTIMFSNKGDVPSVTNEKLKKEATVIAEALSKSIGSMRKKRISANSKTELVHTWRLADHYFVLSWQENEFVKLKVYTKSRALASKTGVLHKKVSLKKIAKNVYCDKKFGDVYIKNIPMVDQGQKGYCAPATAERLFRYVGIEVDQHSIAKNANTGRGGGTGLGELRKNIRRIAGKTHMEYEDLNVGDEFKISKIKKFINHGIPIGWCMYVTDRIEKCSTERTRKRKTMSFDEYQKYLKNDTAKTRNVRADRSGGHIRMIIGYNEKTGEVAFSDTWGEEKYIRWMTVNELEKVTQKAYFCIYPRH